MYIYPTIGYWVHFKNINSSVLSIYMTVNYCCFVVIFNFLGGGVYVYDDIDSNLLLAAVAHIETGLENKEASH